MASRGGRGRVKRGQASHGGQGHVHHMMRMARKAMPRKCTDKAMKAMFRVKRRARIMPTMQHRIKEVIGMVPVTVLVVEEDVDAVPAPSGRCRRALRLIGFGNDERCFTKFGCGLGLTGHHGSNHFQGKVDRQLNVMPMAAAATWTGKTVSAFLQKFKLSHEHN